MFFYYFLPISEQKMIHQPCLEDVDYRSFGIKIIVHTGETGFMVISSLAELRFNSPFYDR